MARVPSMTEDELNLTISCDETTDPDLTHDDCLGTIVSIVWSPWPPRELQTSCSCACHEDGETKDG